MFGYIVINKPELKIKEYDRYHTFYCGLCRALKQQYGLTGQMTLTYDMTFLLLLLTGLYEPETIEVEQKCIAHPLENHTAVENECASYVADMNILLSFYKCQDDWQDEKKIWKGAQGKLLGRKQNSLEKKYPQKTECIRNLLAELSKEEKNQNTNIDYMAGLFGHLLEEVFVYRQDEWEAEMRTIGFYLGKFVYLLDAYEDIEEDMKKDNYNPLKEYYGKADFEIKCQDILTMMISECCKAFEKLPILENVEILRNILYSGVWYRYELVNNRRNQEG